MKMKIISLFTFFVVFNSALASTGAEFFASNNTQEINLPTAYERLIGKAQLDLQNTIIDVLQKNHIEQGKMQDLLGTYRMASDQNITADNSERFKSSPNQDLPDEIIFSLAKELAIYLNQESIAVFIPNHSTIGDITVSFTSHPPTIDEAVAMIHEKLPPLYSQAFSLHLMNKCGEYAGAKVSEVEWLGSKTHLEDIQKAFPQEKINYEMGQAFLVFKNGQKEPL